MHFPFVSPRTAAIYRTHLRSAARELGQPVAELVAELQAGSRSGAELVARWCLAETTRTLAAATVRGRLAAMRACVAAGPDPYQLPRVRVPRPARARYGVTVDDVRRLILTGRRVLGPVSAARFEAAVRLMFDLGLRVGELVALRDDAIQSDALRVTRKGGESVACTLAGPTAAALAAMRAANPLVSGRTLFVTASGAAWAVRGVRSQLATVARAALGRPIPPHALRHAGVTAALAATGGDVRAVAAWAGHRDVRVTLRYDDERRDAPGELARELAALLAVPPAAPQELQHGPATGPRELPVLSR